MKKTGFTLTEVLITLGIVGVIAALTIPALNQNVSQKSIGPSLSKAISNLNAANNNALSKAGVFNLDAVGTNYVKDVLAAQMNGVLSDDETTFYSADGISYTTQNANQKWQFAGNYSDSNNSGDNSCTGNNGQSRECSCEEYEALDDNTTSKDLAACFSPVGAKYGGQYTAILIDINGNKGNGAQGYETFRVFVDSKGYIIPGGSQEARDYLDTALNHAVKTNDDCSASASEDCTAAIMQNGWVVDY